MRSLLDRIRDYRYDPYFPSPWLLSVNLAIGDMVEELLNHSLLNPSNPIPRKLKVWERVLLWLGF